MGGFALLQGVAPPADPQEAALNLQVKSATLGDLSQQRQLRQQQSQLDAMKVQELQEEQEDQRKLTSLYTQHNGDINKVIQDAPTYGVRPKTIQALQTQHQESLLKSAQTDEATNKVQADKADRLAGYLQPISEMTDPAQKAAAYTQARTEAIAKGLITEQDASPNYPGDDGIKMMLAHAMGGKQYAEYGLKKQTEARETLAAQTAAAREKRETAKAPFDLTDAQNKATESTTKGASQELANADSQGAWDTILAKYPGSKDTFGAVWSPEAARRAAGFGITPEQRATAAALEKTREEADKDRDQARKDTQAYRNSRIAQGAGAVQQRFNIREQDAAQKQHDELQQKEQEKWKLAGQIGDMLSPDEHGKPKTAAVDPLHPEKTVDMSNGALQSFYQKQYDATRKEAEGLAQTQKAIRQRFGGGEFAKGTASNGPPASMLKEGVRTNFKNGESWTLENGKPKKL